VPKEYLMAFFWELVSIAARATMRNHVRQLYHLEPMTRYLCAKETCFRTHAVGHTSYWRQSECRKNPMSQIFNLCKNVLEQSMVWLSNLPRQQMTRAICERLTREADSGTPLSRSDVGAHHSPRRRPVSPLTRLISPDTAPKLLACDVGGR
jgi:hypothetical protein